MNRSRSLGTGRNFEQRGGLQPCLRQTVKGFDCYTMTSPHCSNHVGEQWKRPRRGCPKRQSVLHDRSKHNGNSHAQRQSLHCTSGLDTSLSRYPLCRGLKSSISPAVPYALSSASLKERCHQPRTTLTKATLWQKHFLTSCFRCPIACLGEIGNA